MLSKIITITNPFFLLKTIHSRIFSLFCLISVHQIFGEGYRLCTCDHRTPSPPVAFTPLSRSHCTLCPCVRGVPFTKWYSALGIVVLMFEGIVKLITCTCSLHSSIYTVLLWTPLFAGISISSRYCW